MSLGYGAWAVLEMEDDQTALYRYGCYHWDMEASRNPENLLDGQIWIEKSALIEPEIHEKLKHLPKGKKKHILKRIPLLQPVEEPLRSGQFQIQNSRFCWKLLDGQYDVMAVSLLQKISEEYQQTGFLPKHSSLVF